MHPILRSGNLGLYLLAWSPIVYALALLLTGSARLSWPASLAMAVPLCVIYAFVCLSAWYPSRALPLGSGRLARVLVAHVMSASVAAAIWVLTAVAVFAVLRRSEAIRAAVPGIYGLGIVVYLLAVAVNYVLLAIDASRQAEAHAVEARLLAGRSELRALKAQINPHFLFNSLHSISALTSIDAAKAREMCVLLSGFLRGTLGLGDKALIPLHEELAMARSYLAIERVRLGSRLQVEEDIESHCEDWPVPPLILQPLVENAIVHGIANLIEPGLIRISAKPITGGGLSIVIENSLDADAPPSKRPGGFGLAMARKRLSAHYDGAANLFTAARNDTYRAEIRLPENGAANL
ncbi:MAG: histidine kinase [Acidobacteriia bacterium]|nr:histidine kinase [Terriglobia bacterium]